MQPALASALLAAFAALAGILLGYWLRHASARTERLQHDRRLTELSNDLATLRNELAQAHSLAASRAGFESLASEREKATAQLAAERESLRADLQTRIEAERVHSARIRQLETELQNERQNLQEKLALLEAAKQSLAHQFQSLAAEILDTKSKSFAEGTQKELGTLLNPLRDQISDFRKRVEEAQTDSKTGVTKLETLIGTLNNLNQQLSEEARNLTTALRGSTKSQGDWGEFILRDLLEKSGLREGEQYSFQQSFSGVEGGDGERGRSVRTDVLLSLPGGRSLVIDSKVSLTAYTDCVGASCDEDRKAALKLHIASVRGHIANLSKAGYHRLPGVEAPDFVVLFVPIEPAFLMALQNDSALWSDAYRQGILLVGPTTLLYVIRIINVLWQQELQARSVQDVINRGTELYEKFVGFVTDMGAIGDSLERAQSNYSKAMNKLVDGRGNLVRQVEMLKQLGIRTNKSIPRNLVDTATIDEPVEETFTLAAQADTTNNGVSS